MRAADLRNERRAHGWMDTTPIDPELQRWFDAAEGKRKARAPRTRFGWLPALLTAGGLWFFAWLLVKLLGRAFA